MMLVAPLEQVSNAQNSSRKQDTLLLLLKVNVERRPWLLYRLTAATI